MIPKHLPTNWIHRLIGVLDIPNKPETVKLFTAWARAEGGMAQFNPLNTTLSLNKCWNYNSVGVKNFAHGTDGICATALTLKNGYYPGIMNDLKTGEYTAKSIVTRNAKEFDTWGTGSKNILGVL